jgi:hypothetical protein
MDERHDVQPDRTCCAGLISHCFIVFNTPTVNADFATSMWSPEVAKFDFRQRKICPLHGFQEDPQEVLARQAFVS